MRMTLLWAAAGAALWLTAPAAAQAQDAADAPAKSASDSPLIAALKTLVARPDPSIDNAGDFEATLLSRRAVGLVATSIGKALGELGATTIVIAQGEPLDWSAAATFDANIALLEQAAATLHGKTNGLCAAPDLSIASVGTQSIPSAVLALIPDLIPHVASVKGLTVTMERGSQDLADVVAAKVGGTRPALVVAADEASILADLSRVHARIGDAADRIAPCARIKAETRSDGQKSALERLATLQSRETALLESLAQTGPSGQTLRQRIALERSIGAPTKVIIVAVDVTGGNLIKRRSLLTAFGANGLDVSGGVAASYRMFDPRTGQVSQAGIVSCAATAPLLRATSAPLVDKCQVSQ